ncbi:hypothetical protein [Acetobacter sp. LMG 32666]|uniref:hypothetical protein n=1 Tax=Acetobacter sp. LMG 32666 TaxID=2959295 RepID=UPI0030C8A3EF
MSNSYPNRYYAQYDTSAAQPTPVLGWLDMSIYSDTTGFPPASALLPITQAQFAARTAGPYGVSNGALVLYVPPAPVIPLTTQAQTAQAWVQQQASLAAAMGEVFTADMKAYVLAINAIASGADTTSTALPTQPADVLAASPATA